MGPTCGRQDTGGPHVGPMNLEIWGVMIDNLPNNPTPDYAQVTVPYLYPIYIA